MPVSGGVRVMHGTVHEAAHGGKILLVCAVFIEKIPVLDCITLDIPPPQCCILAAQTAVGIQRVRVETDHEINDMPMQIFIDNDEPFELANGESTTILLNNGDHVAYAVIDNIESDTISFKTSYKTMIIAITPERNMFGNISLKIEAYEYK